MRRGDIVIVAAPGDYGKPRPALIVQADTVVLSSCTLAPLTSDLRDMSLFRIEVHPDTSNGLERPSHIMIDKLVTVQRAKIARRVGTLDGPTMQRVDRALGSFLGLAEAPSRPA